jgi:two-component system sensor histidine kinase HydH
MAAALILAFWNLLRLARNLDTYRAQEARNRELVALGEVARTLSHEIKNPLGVLKIQSALLKKNSDPSILPNARIIDEEVDRLGLLTDRVRQYLSTTGGTASVFSLSDYLRSFAPRYGDRVVLQALPEDKLTVQVDRDRLGQVLDNLVSNAFESLDQTAASPVEISAVPVHPDRVEIRVADRGKGIPEAVGERVFDLFYTTKTTGSGLGLSLARRYTELSGGKLSYRNREGGGTVFVVALPVHNGGKTL